MHTTYPAGSAFFGLFARAAISLSFACGGSSVAEYGT
jgi:hypothetical protein